MNYKYIFEPTYSSAVCIPLNKQKYMVSKFLNPEDVNCIKQLLCNRNEVDDEYLYERWEKLQEDKEHECSCMSSESDEENDRLDAFYEGVEHLPWENLEDEKEYSILLNPIYVLEKGEWKNLKYNLHTYWGNSNKNMIKMTDRRRYQRGMKNLIENMISSNVGGSGEKLDSLIVSSNVQCMKVYFECHYIYFWLYNEDVDKFCVAYEQMLSTFETPTDRETFFLEEFLDMCERKDVEEILSDVPVKVGDEWVY